jgi:hypothetical protein
VQILACVPSPEESVVAKEKSSTVLMCGGIGMFVSSLQILAMEGFAVNLPALVYCVTYLP